MRSSYDHGVARPTRRGILGLAGAGVLAAAAGCDLSTDPDTDEGSARGDRGTLEAPALEKLVKAGKLPALKERLPVDPLVVEPVERTGAHGNSWRTAMRGPSDTAWLDRTLAYEPLLRWRTDTRTFDREQVLPSVAKSFEVRADGAEYVFTLREGMRWSDGTPFTAADVLFAYNEVLLNEELTPVLPKAFTTPEGPATIEQTDDYTFTVSFPSPHGLFAQYMCTKAYGLYLVTHPKHYLSQFHPDHADDVDALVKESGYADWVEFFDAKRSRWENHEMPVVFAWQITQPVGEGTRLVAERNPYYWKTDPDGRQLPYLDSVVNDFIDSPEVMLLKVTNGEIDMLCRSINSFRNKPVLAQSRESGDYDFFEMANANMNSTIISLNLCHSDAVKREIFNNRDFRIGLSHAINREEIISTAYQRQGEPFQPAPRPESDFYNEELAKQFTEFDVDLANQYLDDAGYGERDGDGIRLGPDGKPISFTVETATMDYGFVWADVMDMVKQYWTEVGIDMSVKPEDSSLLYERKDGNLQDAVVWQGDVGGMDPRLEPRYYMPYRDESNFAIPWATWYQSYGMEGEEPPPEVKAQMEIYDRAVAAADSAEQADLLREVIEIARDQFYAIGISLPPAGYGVRRNNFHNVPTTMMIESDYPEPGPSNPEQYFIE